MNKILIIGQAPAAVKQRYPYDTTMLYEWLSECGISIERAQSIFIFESVSDTFPGFQSNGHALPSAKDVERHWPVLEALLQSADKVIILGAVAAGYYQRMPRTWSCNIKELFLIHPSRRNYNKYQCNKEMILSQLRSFLT